MIVHVSFVRRKWVSMNKEYVKHLVMELSQLQGVGWHTIKLLDESGYLQLENWDYQLLQQLGLQKKLIDTLLQFWKGYSFAESEKEVERQQKMQYRCISIWDDLYPNILRETPQPPWLLYVKGRIELLEKECISIVGTRYPTNYGKQCAKQLSDEYSRADLCIVSGFANGIDSIAHRAAMKNSGSTIAVLPTAITQCYPSNNYELYESLASEGLLLSESVIARPVHPGQFHQRNRIIAGLCRATIIVEGEKKSGSMITAKHAIDMDREVFALPGPINCSKSDGPNFLIQKGYARMLMSSQELFEELSWLNHYVNSHNDSNQNEKQLSSKGIVAELSLEERKVLSLIQDQPLTINDIFIQTSIPFGQLNVILLNLCIKQFVELQPGSIYIAL